ncbi:unnamed protein product [Rotaria magnacalcarata]|uniref:Uncharacterized protein n=1 Tax=Rotaria magnacalcarata TaxID=392030 RepID=A0A815LN37_9BILA|nr:unnamed protein product [Rotaria magnacalcarata]CAF4529134.1 unnamed protein product [Rotaria magnacalcarata]
MYFVLILQLIICCLGETKLKLNLDEFFDNTDIKLLSFSPTGQHLLIQSRNPSWNSSSFHNNLWLFNIKENKTKLITNNLASFSKVEWSPTGNKFAFLINEDLTITHSRASEHHLYLYSIISNQIISISIGNNIPFALTWSDNDYSLFFTTILFQSTNEDKNQWKNVIRHRQTQTNEVTTIYRIDINESTKITLIKNISFFIGELLYVPLLHKLVFTSVSRVIEQIDIIEIYSIDLNNSMFMLRLTNNQGIEQDLKLSYDGRHLLFRSFTLGSDRNKFTETFDRIFSIDLINGKIESFGKDFPGTVTGYTIKPDGGIFFLGQLLTEIQIYEQNSPTHNIIYHKGWNGTYDKLSISNKNNFISFVHSSFTKAKEVYVTENIEKLQSAKAITNFNQLFNQRDLPQGKVYQWKNNEDNQTIEGILRYPPGKFEQKNLPLLVLIHGGLYTASLNGFQIDWENWGILAASQGWLVFEPNYRGSTGYGNQFVHQVRYQFLSRPAKDILSGIDQLIKENIADPNKLNVGGYSYGGYLTNWLITQTTRFNAALSGAGAIEHSSEWGIIDFPIFEYYVIGGAPWEVPNTYQNEAAIYQLDKVRTPTHIITGENDVRVSPGQSYMLERALHYLKIPVQLLIFPNEDHSISNNPWHGKIKVREELKWLQKYGHQSFKTIIK